MRGLRAFLGMAMLSLAIGHAAAAEWPERAIIFVVPFSPGGTSSVVFKALADEASKTLGVPIVLEYKPGGQGTIGPSYLARAEPDGYKIGALSSSGMTVVPQMMEVSYTIDSFDYIGASGRIMFGLAVAANSPFKSLDDMIVASKKGTVIFGTSGPPPSLPLMIIGKKVGGDFMHIPFKSGGDATMAVIGDHVQAALQGPIEFGGLLKTGKLRLIASASSERWKDYPDVPTFRELGYDIAIESLLGVGAPKGVPADRLKKLRAAFSKALTEPSVLEIFAKMSVVPIDMPGDEYKAVLAEEYKRMSELFTEFNLRNAQ